MSYKCKICGRNDVRAEGETCPSCAWKIKAYLDDQARQSAPAYAEKEEEPVRLNDGSELHNEPYRGKGDIVKEEKKGKPEQLPDYPTDYTLLSEADQSKRKRIVSCGVVKNVEVKSVKRKPWVKWLRALFLGVPVTAGDETTYFQVFQDRDEQVYNAYGRVCDQVMIYGRLKGGTLSEGNTVEVYGHRGLNKCIKAKKVVNTSSGTTIKSSVRLSSLWVWLITLLVLGAIAFGIYSLVTIPPVWSFITRCGWISALILLAMIVLIAVNLPKTFKIIGVSGGVIVIVVLLILYFMQIL